MRASVSVILSFKAAADEKQETALEKSEKQKKGARKKETERTEP